MLNFKSTTNAHYWFKFKFSPDFFSLKETSEAQSHLFTKYSSEHLEFTPFDPGAWMYGAIVQLA